MKFAIICLLIFAALTFLRYCEDSPIRSWKVVASVGLILGFVTWHYLKWAFPPAPPLPPREEKVALNKAELERTFRRIADVRTASIEGNLIRLDFNAEKPDSEFRRIALSTGGTAANFLSLHSTNRMLVVISVNNRQRYSMMYDTQRGVLEENQ